MKTLRLAVFQSHPTQNFAPLWRELTTRGRVVPSVHYYCRANIAPRFDPHYGTTMSYNVDLLDGYEHEFLPRLFPWSDEVSTSVMIPNAGIRACVLRRPWDAAIVFGYSHLNNWQVLRECRRRNIPVLYFSDSNIRTMKTVGNWKSQIKSSVVRRFFNNISCFLSPSTSNAEYLRHFGADTNRIVRFPFPVDVERIRRTAARLESAQLNALRNRLRLEQDDFVVAYLGKLYEGKRPKDLADAIQICGIPRARALFIGSGPLEEQLRNSGDHVRVTGFVNQQEVPEVLSLADLCVMPSAIDAFGLCVTEALALGIPTLVSDRCGCHGEGDVLIHGVNGYVYPCGDISKLAATIATLARDHSLLVRCKSEALRRAETQSIATAAEAVSTQIARLAWKGVPRVRAA